MMVSKVPAEGKGVIVRYRLEEAGVQSCETTCLRADAQAGPLTMKYGAGGEKSLATRLVA